jgi:chromosome segregation ATPase
MKRVSSEVQQQIQELEKKINSLKKTVKNLDDSYYNGAIQEKEYMKMKKSLADNIKTSMDEIKKLRSE